MNQSLKYITALALATLLFSCRQQTQEETIVTAGGPGAEQQLCYLQVTQGQKRITTEDIKPGAIDSLFIRLQIKNGQVTGTMNWMPEEKDRMTGTLDGTLQGNIITAVYTYQSEGVSAREEKVFKLDTNSIWLMTGELKEKNSIWVIENKEDAFFAQSVPKVPCP